jgi:uncharacterized protein YkwD
MPGCVVCGVESSVTASCPHCATPVCAEHRSPTSHDCRGVEADHTSGWVVDLDGAASADASANGSDPLGRRAFPRPRGSGTWLAVATLFVLVVAVALVVAGPSTAPPDGAVIASADNGSEGEGEGAHAPNETRVERLVAERVNAERRERGLDPLAYDRTLARVGEAHSADMRERGFVGHENPDGEGLRERYAAFGLDCPGGENVYHSPNGGLASSSRVLADHVVDAWMGSEGHRGAILKDRFVRQGVGVAVGPDGNVWVTQDFC